MILDYDNLLKEEIINFNFKEFLKNPNNKIKIDNQILDENDWNRLKNKQYVYYTEFIKNPSNKIKIDNKIDIDNKIKFDNKIEYHNKLICPVCNTTFDNDCLCCIIHRLYSMKYCRMIDLLSNKNLTINDFDKDEYIRIL
jgi:hypothetical protein